MATLAEIEQGCSQSMAALARLGRASDAEDALDTAESTSYDAILSDTSRSQSWITTECARRYISVMTQLGAQLDSLARDAQATYKADAAKVFGIDGLDGDPATLTISLRDAQDRIADEYDTVKLGRLLDQAVLNGDDVKAHAIAEQAVTSNNPDVTQQFMTAYPNLADATQRLWDTARNRITTAGVTTAWRVGALKPGILGNLQPYEIEAAAAGRTDVGRWNVP